eukprot:8160851-Prorocentrum_lima.AAC.1
MTSSLVGSEMCIRDRHIWDTATPPTQLGKDRAQRYFQHRPKLDALQPVSYTHLTLPTICSV